MAKHSGDREATQNSNRLGCFSQLFIFKIFRLDEFKHRVTKTDTDFSVIEAPSHFVKVSSRLFAPTAGSFLPPLLVS